MIAAWEDSYFPYILSLKSNPKNALTTSPHPPKHWIDVKAETCVVIIYALNSPLKGPIFDVELIVIMQITLRLIFVLQIYTVHRCY